MHPGAYRSSTARRRRDRACTEELVLDRLAVRANEVERARPDLLALTGGLPGAVEVEGVERVARVLHLALRATRDRGELALVHPAGRVQPAVLDQRRPG